MYTIIEHIEHLLMSHDCVVIPGWGAMIAQYTGPQYSPTRAEMTRPERRLGFNPSVNHNDGMLAQSLIRRENINYDEAMRFIGQSVNVFRKQLAAGNEIALGRMGIFRPQKAGGVDFIPFKHKAGCDDYYGLRSLSLTPLSADSGQAAIANRPWHSNRYVRIAASIVALLCLTALLTTPMMVDREKTHYAALNLTEVTPPQSQTLTTTAAARHDRQNAPTGLLLDEGGTNYLVIAALTTAQQVTGYMEQHSDLEGKMQVLKVNERLYYIYVARSNDARRLWSFREQLPAAYGDAWVKS